MDRAGRRPRFSGRDRLAAGFFAFFVLLTVGFWTAKELRRERFRLMLLHRQVERAMAPGEPVLVESWVLYRTLRWKGSAALKEQVVLVKGEELSSDVLVPGKEAMVVAGEGSPLLSAMRARGFLVSEDASRADREKLVLYPAGRIGVYFVVGQAGEAR